MKRLLASLLLLSLLLTGCAAGTAEPPASSGDPATATVFAMDTVMDLTIYGDPALLTKAESEILRLEGLFSVTEDTSEIARLNREGTVELSGDTAALLEQGLALCEMTGGALDLSVYPVLRAWGFTTGAYRVPDGEEIAALLPLVDYGQLSLTHDGTAALAAGMEIDLGSVAKGYTGDVLARLFRENGVTSGLLNLGGNVQAIGAKLDGSPWRVAIRDPLSGGNLAVLEIVDQAVITSGGYERYFEQDGETYWHILDPATGYPARSGVLSATIVGDSGVVCDGLSTALFVMGVDAAARLWREQGGFEALLVTDDGTIYLTAGLEDRMIWLDAAVDFTVEVIR